MTLIHFFQTMPIPADQLLGSYDARLVILSYLVATFASYIALDITGRLRDIDNTVASGAMWLLGGAFAMGAGIWSMHFIGMLAFNMPMMTMHYDLFWTGASMVVAVLASGFALYLLKEKTIRVMRLAIGGVILGLAIASMHYVGMEAMKIDMQIHYLPSLFFASIAIAIISSEAALWLALKSNQAVMRLRVRLKIVSALLMGAAICGMHYTGMAAAIFTVDANHIHGATSSNQDILAISIAGVTFIILSIAFLVSTYKEALNQQSLLTARQAGMAEVAATVLHNVGNVLNSIVVSAEVIDNKIAKSQLNGLSHLDKLMQEHQHDLSDYISKDARGVKIPSYISELSSYWLKEKATILHETKNLINHISHVKDIIALQQELSKTTTFEQIISVEELLEEAQLVIGLDSKNEQLQLIKNYAALKPITIDKVKLLQILINLLRNAKDAVTSSHNAQKIITITTSVTVNNMLSISIADNGVGVLAENQTRIFAYGFTTKPNGHGFGLHSSAIAANEMGGAITVTSNGQEKGATFTLTLPYDYVNNGKHKVRTPSEEETIS